MEELARALVMGIAQGLTEFLPVSSSGHHVLIPALLGWDDPFIESLSFSVVLHGGTLLALLVHFRADWLRLVPAGLAAVRDRSLRGDPDRLLALLLVLSTIPAGLAALLLDDLVEGAIRDPAVVAAALVVAGLALGVADRWAPRTRAIGELGPRGALAIGAAQALALIPGVSRSGISMTAGRLAGLDRADAARYSFLMATPITGAALAWELLGIARGEVAGADPAVLAVGVVASFVSGMAAIAGLLRYVRTRSFDLFVAYRLALAVTAAALLAGR